MNSAFFLISLYILYCILLFFKLKSKIYYKLIAFTIPIPMCFFNPIKLYYFKGLYVDTFRIYGEMELFRLYGWNAITTYDGAILSKIYIFLYSLLNVDELLPIMNCFFVYFFILYTVNKIGVKLRAKENIKCIVILYTTLLINYFYVTTNIRYPLTLAICFMIIIYDFFYNNNYIYKKIILVLSYFSLLMLHPGIIFIIFFRVLLVLPVKLYFLATIIVIIMANAFLEDIIFMLMGSSIPFLGLLGDKYTSYSEIDLVEFNFLNIVVCVITNFVVIVMSLILKKYLLNNIYIKYNKFILFNFSLSILAFIFAITESQFMHRLDEFVIYLSVIYIYIIAHKNNFKLKKGYLNLVVFSLFMFGIMLSYFVSFNLVGILKRYIYYFD